MTSPAAVWHDSGMASGRVLVVPSVVAAVVLGACGGSAAQVPTGPSQAVPAPAPKVLTARHHLKSFRLARGRAIELRLPHGFDVKSSARSVSLTPIEFFVDPGYVAWEVTGAARGRAVLKSSSAGKPFRVTLVVPG